MLSLFLLLTLLLTACGTPATEPVTEPTAETTEQDSTPSETPPPSTEAPPTTETTLPSTEETQPPTQTHKPTSGVTVDFSVYTQGNSSLSASLYSLPEGNADKLPFSTPRPLYPYTGAPLRSGYGYVQGHLFGLTDSSGILITPPIYTDIYPLYNHETKSSLPIWVVEQTEKTTEEWDGELYDSAEQKLGLVAMDGSFVLDCIYNDISLYADRIVCGRYVGSNSDRAIIEAYDAEGNLRFSTENYSFHSELASCYATYGEGLYVLSLRDTSPDAQEYDSLSYFVSEDGQVQYGPYYSAQPFCEGIAPISLSREQSTYLKRDGTVFPETYAYTYSFRNGFAIIANEQWQQGLIDTQGNMYIVPAGYIFQNDDGSYITYGNSDDGALPTYCYDKDGTYLWEITEDWSDVFSKDLLYYKDGNSTIIRSMATGKSLPLPEQSYGNYHGHSTDPFLIFYSYGEDEASRAHYIVTSDLEIFAKFPTPEGSLPEPVVVIGESCNGFSLRDGEKVTLYRSPNNPVGTFTMPEFKTATVFPNGSISFLWETHSELYDKDGNLIFRYVFAIMDD